ncbi:MAG: flagellar basal-body rod protein FlgG [Blastomonas fulva]|jgi:flagellar basal-body rod protein FlgG|uniref:Flagellar basal-body rod protein FlgG n=1 Tax=Blastomonas fulva TaxID=1550728 RepID=A0ABN5B1I3_9SPHN|nr:MULTISPECIES: flagellar basal-body rod protein FlgG [Blastomonas]AOG01553.1 flagellar basal-body rod protein FlgG [Blastomonas sp. RAC04]ASR50736.1 flagellar basal-body rod protein FlgG [Blastomonas fulva]KPF74194.1 flagellar basal-body rod protein FlgG [Blastomonas sp. AAP25]MCO5791822.1 flagellar basal-body rod protein FlgG [Blastomonas sp.]MDK2757586.1 flagellar basal-body rod protein FlgG [Blastomonas fulva]
MSNGALQVARTGLDAQNTKMRVIANNLANVNTTGFKRDRANFETLAYQQQIAPGARADAQNRYATGLSVGTGVKVAGTSRIDTQGSAQITNNALDLMIEGNGYFQVQLPDGSFAFTRAGNFNQTAEGLLVTPEGLPVVPNIQIPPGVTGITIGADGMVSATLAGQAEPSELGQIEIASFVNPAGLQSLGDNLLAQTAASGPAVTGAAGLEGRGKVRQGALEGSNVNIVEELVDMIETQRAYEVNSKMIQATDEMLQFANQQMG